ncbi:TonB-dependent receptor [Fulvivirga sp. M361]|uniref:SusC/RagA family TonB-linked outer membrane protein n=1 Tax=Fulvivirga sp. M361 TaxID=2594266 RepID=UPI001179E920|nr:TonB-dependent receptor [Fulvivirga sp. M361]TRX61188.1 TonB-dependent receptor [Fulvivirga sp. M361]
MKKNLQRTLYIMSGLFTLTFLSAVFGGILYAADAGGQSIRDVTVSLELREAPLTRVFSEIEEHTEFEFLVDSRRIAQRNDRITLNVEEKSVAYVLQTVAEETGLSFRQLDGTIVTHIPSTPVEIITEPFKATAPEDQIISGTVTDENGQPLPGANILLEGTAQGTITDADGNYTLEMADEVTTLVVSFIGYSTQKIEIAGRKVIDVVLKLDVTSLEAVVVSTGYWETPERLNPGNIAKVSAEIIEQQPVVNPLQAMQGRVAGVQIQETSGIPGSAININIRGLNSLNNGQDGLPNANLPFYVIDGVPFVATSLNSGFLPLSGGSPLASLRPSDIESIEILKDADATAIYGSRGANGVILITTKKGRAGKTKVDINISRGVGEVVNKVDLLNTDQYLSMRREALVNDGVWPILTPQDSTIRPDIFAWNPTRNTDWQEELLGGTAEQTNAGISISGGTKLTQFVFRASFFKQTNVYNYDNSAFKSGSGHFNLNHSSVDNRFNINVSTTYTFNTNNQNGGDLVGVALRLAPNAPSLFDEDGNLNWENNFENPLGFLRQEYENDTRNLTTNAVLSYELITGLKAKATLGYTNITVDEIQIRPLTSFNPEEDELGDNRIANSNNDTWIIEPQLEYTRKLGDGDLKVLVGTTFQESIQNGQTIIGDDYTADALIRDINAAGDIGILGTNYSEYRYNAIYARVNYNWRNKYILNLTGRRDGSSRFGPGKQFGNFGAIGGAWLFSNEGFIENNLPFLSFGKLRGSYGVTGNDQIGNYGFLNTFESVRAYNNVSSLVLARASNEDFSWETNKKLEFGIELGLWQDKVSLSTSWYRNRSSDQLIGRPLPATTGFSQVQFNLPALVENRGWEFELSTVNLKTDNFQWTSSANLTIFNNELKEFDDIEMFPAFDNRFEVGRPLFGRKEFKSLGVDPETGDFVFEDVNADGNIDELDRQDFVEIAQDYFGGLNNSFRYKFLQLDVFFQFVKQNALSFNSSFSAPGVQSNQPLNVLNRWTNVGDISEIRSFTQAPGTEYFRNAPSNNAIQDASFIRLKNVSISWLLPSEWINKINVQSGRIYVQGQNLLTITSYDGLDPESRSLSLPPLRIISAGVQIGI